jgi:hypothetical protein
MKIKILALFLLISSANAMEPMPSGPHLQMHRFLFKEMIPANSTKTFFQMVPHEIVGGPGVIKTWESAQSCIKSSTPNDKMSINIRVRNMDIDTGNIDDNQYYYNSVLTTWQGNLCDDKRFDIPVHIQHNLRIGLNCTNYSDTPALCKVTLFLMAQ